MSTILSNVTAIYKLNLNVILCGTSEGNILSYNAQTDELTELYRFQTGRPIIQMTVESGILGVIVQGDNSYDEEGIPEYSQIYHIALNDLSKGAVYVGKNADVMMNPFTMLMYNSMFYGAYILRSGKVEFVRNMEFFEGENIFDQLGFCFAINRYMGSSKVYTLRMNDFANWKSDTFSFEGNFFCEIGEYLGEHPIECDDPDDIMVEQEEVMNSRLPSSMVSSVHHKFTYLDFVKLYDSGDKDNPFIVTGARDHKVVITDFNAHKVFFEKEFETSPRCCTHDTENVYVGFDEGAILIINKSTFIYQTISLGDERFKLIEAVGDGKYVAAVNSDNAVFYIDVENKEVVGFEQVEEGIKSLILSCNNAFALTNAGNLVKIEF